MLPLLQVDIPLQQALKAPVAGFAIFSSHMERPSAFLRPK